MRFNSCRLLLPLADAFIYRPFLKPHIRDDHVILINITVWRESTYLPMHALQYTAARRGAARAQSSTDRNDIWRRYLISVARDCPSMPRLSDKRAPDELRKVNCCSGSANARNDRWCCIMLRLKSRYKTTVSTYAVGALTVNWCNIAVPVALMMKYLDVWGRTIHRVRVVCDNVFGESSLLLKDGNMYHANGRS